MSKDKSKQEIQRESIVKWVKKANKFCRTYWEHGKQCQEWFDCEHKSIHDLNCLSCGQKVR